MTRSEPGAVERDVAVAAGSEDEATLADLVNRVLDRGVVVTGEVVISVAGVDLVYLGLRVLLSSVETLERADAIGGDA